MKFYLINNTTWSVPEAFLKWVLAQAQKDLQKRSKKNHAPLKKTVGVVIIGNANMKALNKKYRRKNKVTDVLSFSGDHDFLGDIVLCLPQIQKQAKEHQLSEVEEFTYLLIHGLLHLLGYDHEVSASEAKKMFKIQDKLFADLQDRDILKTFEKKMGSHGKKT